MNMSLFDKLLGIKKHAEKQHVDKIVIKKDISSSCGNPLLASKRCGITDYSSVIIYQFKRMIFSLFSEVEFTYLGLFEEKFENFVNFFNSNALNVYQNIFNLGHCVVVWDENFCYKILQTNQYSISISNGKLVVILNSNCYFGHKLLLSDCYEVEHISDRDFLEPYCNLLNSYLTSSKVVTERLGALIVLSPKESKTGFNLELTESEIFEYEKLLSERHGSLEIQSQSLILPKPMDFAKVSLMEGDIENWEKAIRCISVIAGHFDLPAAQLPIMELITGKSLSNGGELQEAEKLKYKTFDRILRYFLEIADPFKFSYIVKNKPIMN